MFTAKLLALVLAACLMALPAAAAETPVFGEQPLSGDVTGICITEAPTDGALLLGSRVVRSGDVLTAQQVGQMTFTGEAGSLAYLPVFQEGLGESTVVTFGKRRQSPIAEDSAVETYQNLPITGKLQASGDDLTFTITRSCKRGTVELGEDGTFTYTPRKNKIGIDSFTYTATSNGETSREATVTITILKPNDSTQYTDTQGLDCRFTAEWLKNTGIFTGETIGEHCCFQPEKYVTRGEFVTMLVKALDLPVDEDLTTTGYPDDLPQWLQPYLAAALRAGLTTGDKETFGAGESITVAQAQAMAQSDLPAAETTSPDLPLTRAQAAKILYEAHSNQ